MLAAILNGAIGDSLVRRNNPLAVQMGFVRPLEAGHARTMVLIHGLMCDETIWRFADGSTYGSRAQRDFAMQPAFIRYNSGLSVAENGAQLSTLLGGIDGEITLVGYSMGGLVARSACHHASLQGEPWLARVKRAIYVGTPHTGAPLERVARVVSHVLRAIPDPYTRLLSDIAQVRSAGIRDLGDARLRHEDEERLSLFEAEHPVPLLPQLSHHLVAGSLFEMTLLSELFGDAMVPVPSGTHRRAGIAPENVALLPQISHIGLARDERVYGHIRRWCES
jgi:triacylglycerol lipase